jgi:hypothetical protein
MFMAQSKFEELRDMARELIREGRLPATTNPRHVTGENVMQPEICHLCEKVIEVGETRYVIRSEGKVMGLQQYGGLHFLCHAAWQIEAAEVG